MGTVDSFEAVQDTNRPFTQQDSEGSRLLLDPETECVQMEGVPRGGRRVGADAILDGVFAGFGRRWEIRRAVIVWVTPAFAERRK